MSQLRTKINDWIDEARTKLANEIQLPLIDDEELSMSGELQDPWKYGGSGFLADLEDSLSRNPNDLPTRFVVLNAAYRLMRFDSENEEEKENESDKTRKFRERLAYLVRLREVSASSELHDIRWEIVNSCIIEDFDRAIQYLKNLELLLPPGELHYICGRLHFLIATGGVGIDNYPNAWDLPFGPSIVDPKRELLIAVRTLAIYSQGLKEIPSASLSEYKRDHFHAAIGYFKKKDALSASRPSARFMLARSRSEVGDFHEAAQQYQSLLDNWDYVIKQCGEESNGSPAIELIRIPDIHRCLVNAWSKSGESEKATTASENWAKACPDDSVPYLRMSEICAQKCEYQSAYEKLREAVDRNSTLNEHLGYRIALALGAIGNSDNSRRKVSSQIQADYPTAIARIQTFLLDYWSTFKELDPQSQAEWATAEFLLREIPGSARNAGSIYAWVLEQELKSKVFDKFRDAAPEVYRNSGDKNDQHLVGIWKPEGKITLGELLYTIMNAAKPRSPLMKEFSKWINKNFPKLVDSFQLLPIIEIIELRGTAQHKRTFSLDDAKRASQISRQILDKVFEK